MRKILISIEFLENRNAMINYHQNVPSLTNLKMLGELTQNILLKIYQNSSENV